MFSDFFLEFLSFYQKMPEAEEFYLTFFLLNKIFGSRRQFEKN